MRLHRVQLRNYRGVVKSDVSFSQDGVTIVEGPNEVGKTAISEGLQFAIDLPDSSKSAQVKAVQPVGRDEGPEVEISLSSGKYDLVYRKRWLRQIQKLSIEVMSPTWRELDGAGCARSSEGNSCRDPRRGALAGIANRAGHRVDAAQFWSSVNGQGIGPRGGRRSRNGPRRDSVDPHRRGIRQVLDCNGPSKERAEDRRGNPYRWPGTGLPS